MSSMLVRSVRLFARRAHVSVVPMRGFAKETIAPYTQNPEVKIEAEITKYDAATEKRLAALAAKEPAGSSPYTADKLWGKEEESEIPKWGTNFFEIMKKAAAH
ncbi:hypothetical protein AAMO2058_001591000 [Amorphochlora amoebiformis]